MPKTEQRSFRSELRTEISGDKRYLVGRAASFGVMSKDLAGFREILAPNCFDDALSAPDADVLATINHDNNLLLGRTASGTLRLTSDAQGLNYKVLLPATTYASDLAALCNRGDISQSSFAFTVEPGDDEWSLTTDPETGEKVPLRTINRIRHLYDVSVVHTGAYPRTAAQLSDRALPGSMPPEMRALLLRSATEECECECPECVDGECDECSEPRCEDARCATAGCPGQTGSDRAAANARALAIAEAAL